MGDRAAVQDFLGPICRFFPGLKALSLDLLLPDSQAQLDLAVLQPLTSLQRLSCSEWEHVGLRSTTVLQQLTRLAFSEVAIIHIDAAFPSLQLLAVDTADTFVLTRDPCSEQLYLPQLSELRLSGIDYTAAGLDAAPRLARFEAVEFRDLRVCGMAELRHLTSLVLHCHWKQGIGSALEIAPPTLLHLELVGFSHVCSQPPPFHFVPRLTSLACDKLTIIPYLGSLTDLQHLDFPTLSASALTLEHMEWLCELTSLRRLHFGADVQEGGAGRRRLKMS